MHPYHKESPKDKHMYFDEKERMDNMLFESKRKEKESWDRYVMKSQNLSKFLKI